ncbi:hypothetical protein TNCV_1983651 [Trichonephila clavipes]|nr:hypothetical protein TNCV_1983651 [Trichonephila clavipes]
MFHPNIEGEHLGVVRCLPTLFPFHQPHERTCGSTAIYSSPYRKGTVHLQTSMSSPGFEPRPYGTAVSVANHYTGWTYATSVGAIKLLGVGNSGSQKVRVYRRGGSGRPRNTKSRGSCNQKSGYFGTNNNRFNATYAPSDIQCHQEKPSILEADVR